MSDFPTQDFIQSFLEETDEHLQSIHRNLLALEHLPAGLDSAGMPAERSGRVDELFRSFHTIKGLSSMMGLEAATELSHAMEAVLKGIRQGQLEVSGLVIDRLLEGTRTLEKAIATLRGPGASEPDAAADIEALDALLRPEFAEMQEAAARPPAGESVTVERPVEGILPALAGYPDIVKSLAAEDLRRIQAALKGGQSLSLAIFTPTPEKSERGENVNQVRQRLAESGEILKSVPLIVGTSVRFGFLVVSVRALDAETNHGVEIIDLRPAPEPQPVIGPAPAAHTYVRVDMQRMDELMRLAGDLVILRGRLAEQIKPLNGAATPARRELEGISNQMGRLLRSLNQSILRARLVPLSEAFNRMPLVVRDMARETGKDVRLEISGEETQIDKTLVDALLDPLLHLVRNAVVHGVESPEERAESGKPAASTLTLRGEQAGEYILVSVSDDGCGIDMARVLERVRSMGLGEVEEPSNDTQLLDLISRTGFSTRLEATRDAGRGLGLDIVQRSVKALGGVLSMHSVLGEGTTFTIRMPYTLVIMETILVRCGSERYSVPQSVLNEVIEIDPQRISRLESGELYPYQDGSLALLRLSRLFGIPEEGGNGPERLLYGLVSGEGEGRFALVVDQLISRREVVMTPLKDPLVARPGITGAAELGDGKPVLILDLPSLFQFAMSGSMSHE